MILGARNLGEDSNWCTIVPLGIVSLDPQAAPVPLLSLASPMTLSAGSYHESENGVGGAGSSSCAARWEAFLTSMGNYLFNSDCGSKAGGRGGNFARGADSIVSREITMGGAL